MRQKTIQLTILFVMVFLASIGGLFAQADLNLSLSQQPNTPQQYSVYTVTATITNAGPEAATNVAISIPVGAGVVYQGGNEFTASTGAFSPYGSQSWTLPSLEAGATQTLTINYFLTGTSAPDSYAQVTASDQEDPDSTPGNGTPPTVNEDDEASTLINGGFVPDLTLGNLVLAQNPVDSGAQIDFSFDINNDGAGSIAQNFLIQAYISTDNQISTDDLQNGTVPTGNFAPGQTVAGVLGASIPVGISPGNYFLILEADANGQVQESNEANNTIAVPLTIQTSSTSTCSINIGSILDATCSDNGTPADNSDDEATYTWIVTNGNSTGMYNVLDTAGMVLGAGTYGQASSFTVPNLDLYNRQGTFTVQDQTDPTCSEERTIALLSPCSFNGRIDLSVGISQPIAQPAQYSIYTVTAEVVNDGTLDATGVVVDLPLPAGVVYQGGNEFSATQGQLRLFGSNEGQWTVGTIPAGQNAEITINYFLNAPSATDSYIEVLAANEQDIDSTPGNGNGQVNEDDEAVTGRAAFPCDLELTIDSIVCNDNGTSISDDDFFYVYLVVNSASRGNGGSYTVGANGTSIPQPAIYGQQYRQFVGVQSIARQGDSIFIRAFDGIDSGCSIFEGFPAPPTCSSTLPCNITAAIQSIDCDDQETQIETDDTYSVTFLVENGSASGTWTADNGGTNPSFSGSYGVPYTLQGGNIFNTINQGGLTLSVNITDDQDASCSTTVTWQTPGSTCSSSADPCDAIDEYQASLLEPVCSSMSTSPEGIIKVIYAVGSGIDSFTFDGPVELGVTPVANNTFIAGDVVCTTDGFAVVGTFRDSINPGSAQPFLFMLDGTGSTVQATIPPFTSSYTDILDFNFVDVATSGAGGDILYVEVFSFSRSHQLAAFDADANLLWQDQQIGDLVTNRIGGSVLSPDEGTIYFSYRDGNSQFWPRFRGVDALTGATRWEQQLAPLVLSNPTGLVSGNVSKPLVMQNGDGTLAFSTNERGSVSFHLTQFDPLGNVIYTTPLQTTNLNVPVFAGENDVVVVSDGTDLSVYEGGELVNCNGTPRGVDLELSAVSAQSQPAIYDVNNITFTLTNNGTETATGITVDVPLPAGVVYTGGNEFTASQGSLTTFGDNVWSVGDLGPGITATLVVNYFSLSAAGYTQYAEVLSLNELDIDSAPGNGNGTSSMEDDEVFLNLTGPTMQALTFFPNPLPQGEQVILDFVSSGETEQTVIFSDLTGRAVHTVQVTFGEGPNQIPVDLGFLPAGVYVISFPKSGLAPKRIIVQE